jgi:hypothetical protein
MTLILLLIGGTVAGALYLRSEWNAMCAAQADEVEG